MITVSTYVFFRYTTNNIMTIVMFKIVCVVCCFRGCTRRQIRNGCDASAIQASRYLVTIEIALHSIINHFKSEFVRLSP